MPLPTIVVPTTQVVIAPNRIRQDPTDRIGELAHSIQDLGALIRSRLHISEDDATGREGLMHLPIARIISTSPMRYELVTGVRRFLACSQVLGWREIEIALMVAATDPLVYLKAQGDENNMREGFTVAERLIYAQQLLDVEQTEARSRQTGGKPLPDSVKGRATERAGAAVGLSHASVEHGLSVIKAAALDPEKYGDLMVALHNNAPIDPTYHEMKRREQYGEAPPPTYQPPVSAQTNALLDRLDGVSSSIRRWLLERLQPDSEPIVVQSGWMQDITINGRDYTVSVLVAPKD